MRCIGEFAAGRGRSPDRLLFLAVLSLFAAALCMEGCASPAQTVRTGDHVKVHYTCRIPDGKVAITTRGEIAGDKAVLAEDVFLPFREYGPEEMTAGDLKPNKNGSFELEIENGITSSVVGMKPGEARTVTLKGRYLEALPESERYIKLSRIRHRPKETTVSVKALSKNLGHDPVIGEKAFSYDGVDGFVKSVEGDKAVIRLDVKEGSTVRTPFGKGMIKDRGETYDIEIDAKVGHIVRSGTIMGRIVAVDPDNFTLDYGHTFGGEELTCDMEVVPEDSPVGGSQGEK
jgi:FKBP-type peptidyl-prolyl cis-trans isomerase 2